MKECDINQGDFQGNSPFIWPLDGGWYDKGIIGPGVCQLQQAKPRGPDTTLEGCHIQA